MAPSDLLTVALLLAVVLVAAYLYNNKKNTSGGGVAIGVPGAGLDGLPLIKLQPNGGVIWTLTSPIQPQTFDLAKWMPQTSVPGDNGVVLRNIGDMNGGRGSVVWCVDKWLIGGFTIAVSLSYSVAWPREQGKTYGDNMNIILFSKARANSDADGLRFTFDEYNKKFVISYNGKEITSAVMADFTDPNFIAVAYVTVPANQIATAPVTAGMMFNDVHVLKDVVIPNFGEPNVLGPLVTISAWSGGATDTFMLKSANVAVSPL